MVLHHPRANTHKKQAGIITQNYILPSMDMSVTKSLSIPQLASTQCYPAQFHLDMASAILDEKQAIFLSTAT
jgi:hypothetical protein